MLLSAVVLLLVAAGWVSVSRAAGPKQNAAAAVGYIQPATAVCSAHRLSDKGNTQDSSGCHLLAGVRVNT